MFDRFTDRARRVVVLAQEEARMLNHNYIGTEHILLGLIREGEGVACQVLVKLGADLNNPFGSTRTICTPPANGLRYRNTDAEEVVGFGR